MSYVLLHSCIAMEQYCIFCIFFFLLQMLQGKLMSNQKPMKVLLLGGVE